MSIAIGELHLYNDTPVLEIGHWKLQHPTKWAVKWKHLSNTPIVVHTCPEETGWRKGSESVISGDNMKAAPRCALCNETVPEGIQALWQLSHMEQMLG
jgi:hypothetical protein